MKLLIPIISSFLLLPMAQAQLRTGARAVRRLRSKNNKDILQVVENNEKADNSNMFEHQVADRELLSRLLSDYDSMSMSMYYHHH